MKPGERIEYEGKAYEAVEPDDIISCMGCAFEHTDCYSGGDIDTCEDYIFKLIETENQ